jgi:hypothetical protein
MFTPVISMRNPHHLQPTPVSRKVIRVAGTKPTPLPLRFGGLFPIESDYEGVPVWAFELFWPALVASDPQTRYVCCRLLFKVTPVEMLLPLSILLQCTVFTFETVVLMRFTWLIRMLYCSLWRPCSLFSVFFVQSHVLSFSDLQNIIKRKMGSQFRGSAY